MEALVYCERCPTAGDLDGSVLTGVTSWTARTAGVEAAGRRGHDGLLLHAPQCFFHMFQSIDT